MGTDITKGILCTTDFSEPSKEALRWSIALAQELGTHLTILYTYRLFNSQREEVIELKKKMEENARVCFSELEKEFLVGKGVSYDFKTEVGFVADRVKEHAKKNGVSFLVMGKRKDIKNRAHDESLDDLVNNIEVPLIIVP